MINRKPYFIMMIGLSGSGKSFVSKTIANKMREHSPVIILSSDDLREELLNNINEQSHNDLIFQEMCKRTIHNLQKGTSVIYDATNLTIKNRAFIMNKLMQINCIKIACVMCTSTYCCLNQNAQRERIVPEEVILKQRAKFQIPLYTEGFDSIELYGWHSPTVNGQFYQKKEKWDNYFIYALDSMRDFNQKTHYHDFTLLEHVERTYLKAQELNPLIAEKKYFERACRAHDIGKPYTQTINKNGECSYYGHANVGTYTLLQNIDCLGLDSIEEVLKCLALINYHMYMFDLERAKVTTIQKKKELFGVQLFEELNLLHEADKWASKKR